MEYETELEEWIKKASGDLPPSSMKRPSWDEYFSRMVKLVGRRSTCLFHRNGAVLVRNNRVLTTGYVGSPKGIEHCTDVGCTEPEWDGSGWPASCRGLHAVQNAVIQAAIFGIEIRGSDLYTDETPCLTCAKMIINSGIKRVLIVNPRYEMNDDVKELLRKGRVKIVYLR